MPGSKNRKKNQTVITSMTHPETCYITQVPLEIIAEVLSYTSSPRDILALARCSKYFCATLVSNPSSQFIWRQARARAEPEPIPDPVSWMSEAAYASLIFDKGKCEVCGVPSKEMYVSFALKVRLCRRLECKKTLEISLKHVPDTNLPFCRWLPSAETTNFLEHTVRFDIGLSSGTVLYRSSDWIDALDEYNKAQRSQSALDEYLAAHLPLENKLPGYMLMCLNLYHWKTKWETTRKRIQKENKDKVGQFAKDEGWEISNLLRAESLSELYSRRNAAFEVISDKDVRLIRSQVEADLIIVQERRARITQSHVRRKNLMTFSQFHHQLNAEASGFKMLPVFSEFSKLPIIKTLQSRPTAMTLYDLQKPLIIEMIQEHLITWHNEMQDAFAEKLGYLKWKTPSSHKLHPVHRPSALFICTICVKKPWRKQVLTFADACSHQCLNSPRRGTQRSWKVDHFVAQDRARKAVERFASLHAIDLELKTSLCHPALADSHILCLSCAGPVVMKFRNMIQHSTRHEDMEMAILSEDEMAKTVEFPLEDGLTAKLFRKDPVSIKEQNAVVYKCRHCCDGRNKSDLSFSSECRKNDRNAGKRGKLMSFNGLRTHLKEKHAIECIDDEDYYRPVGQRTLPSDLIEAK